MKKKLTFYHVLYLVINKRTDLSFTIKHFHFQIKKKRSINILSLNASCNAARQFSH